MESRRFKVRYRRTYVLDNMLHPKTTLKFLNLKIYNCEINIIIIKKFYTRTRIRV